MRNEYLVCYDYGTGGVWLYLLAESAKQIGEWFPEFTIVTERPPWLTEEEDRELHERMTADIDDSQHWFLSQLLRRRQP